MGRTSDTLALLGMQVTNPLECGKGGGVIVLHIDVNSIFSFGRILGVIWKVRQDGGDQIIVLEFGDMVLFPLVINRAGI